MPNTKKSALLAWCREVRLFSTVEIRDWGQSHFFLRCERAVREMVNEGKLRRLPYEEIILRGLRRGKVNIGFWESV